MKYKTYNFSRISNGKTTTIFSLNLPLAGDFLEKNEIGRDEIFPFSLSFCEKSCSLQVNEAVNPNLLFNKYFYKTGSIKSLSNHLQDSAKKIKDKNAPQKILELGWLYGIKGV
jgi:hypothetical protein